MALYHTLDVTIDLAYVLEFFSLISDSLGSVLNIVLKIVDNFLINKTVFSHINLT